MQNLKHTDVLNILKRIDQDSYHTIAKTIIIVEFLIVKKNIKGWRRAINDAQLFRVQYANKPPLNNETTEPAIWKQVYETDMLFGSYEKNYTGYTLIFKKEKYIQYVLEVCEIHGYQYPQIIAAMRKFKTPNFTGIGELVLLFQIARIFGTDLPLFIDYLITLHNWPNCFNTTFSNSTGVFASKKLQTPFNESNFWYSIGEQLQRYIPETYSADESLQNFLVKYHTKLDWKKNTQIYKYINEEFILAHPEIPYFWTTVLFHIKLSEPLLNEIMQAAEAGKQFRNQMPNIAYLAEKQVLSEEFIEKWFVSFSEMETKTPTETGTKRRYDQDYIWDQLLRHQNLSEGFRAKYNHKRSKPAIYPLRSIIQALVVTEEAPPKENVAFGSNIQSLKD